jgi:hypothetical protein
LIQETATKTPSTTYIYVTLVTLAVLVAPVLFLDYMPFVDYPNHLARAYVRANYDHIPILQQTYRSQWQLSPYLAMDLFAVPLAHVMNAYWASRVFLAILVLGFSAGCYALSAAIQHRFTWIAPISCFLVYNSTLMWGFVNYMVGLSVFMLVFAAWLHWRERWTPLKIAAFALLTIFCYLCHLVAYMILGISIGFVALWDLWQRRTTIAAAVLAIVPATLPIGLFLLYINRTGGQIANLASSSGTGSGPWNTWRGKLAEGLIMFRGYNTLQDAGIAAAWAALLLLLVIKRRSVRIYEVFAALGVFMVVLFLVFPRSISANGDGDGFDGRFVLPGVLLLLFSIRLIPDDRLRRVFIPTAFAISFLHLGLLTYQWSILSHRIESATRLFALLPDGARVYPAVYKRTGADEAKTDSALFHIIRYAIIDRHIVDPLFFEAGQLLEMRDRPKFVVWSHGQDLAPFDSYQYVWSYAEPPELRALLFRSAVMIGEREGFTLWRLPAASLPQ